MDVRPALLAIGPSPETGYEHFLFFGLNGLAAICGSNPFDRVLGRMTGESRQPCQSDPGASVPAETADFHALAGASAIQNTP